VQHCEEDELSIIALGEPASAADDAHLQMCSRCQSRLDQLTAVVSSARAITDEDRPVEPPAAVWASITSELGLEPTATVTPISSARSARSSRTWLLAGAAAIVGVLVGGLVTTALANGSDPASVVASTSLEPIADSGFTGTAAVESTKDGAVLRVNVPDLPAVEDGYYEVWMATPDTATMVAIGTLSPGQEGTFSLPAGMEVGSFPVVDVSVEHFDGDAGHSAVSVVRGQLTA
jgi:anti-sigma-K factor RskA